MNERIKELYSKISGKDWMYDFDPDKAEMFAELVIRECAKIADEEQPNSIGCGYITKTKGMKIREYFGVKE